MNIEQHFLHAHRKQVIKLNGHILNARKCVLLGIKYARNIGKQTEYGKIIEENLDALFDGLDETIKICAQAANDFESKMDDPNAVTVATFGTFRRFSLTKLQRLMEKEGRVSFDTIASHERVKPHTFAPKKPFPITLTKKPYNKRKRNRKEGRIAI